MQRYKKLRRLCLVSVRHSRAFLARAFSTYSKEHPISGMKIPSSEIEVTIYGVLSALFPESHGQDAPVESL